MLKKLCVILMAYVLLMCSCMVNVSAQEEYDGFKYTINNNSVKIDEYIGESKNVVIPETINGMPVTTISWSFGCKDDEIDSLYIPKSITTIENRLFGLETGSLKNLKAKEYIVDENNEYYTSYDGALYTKDYKTIIRCPSGKPTVKIRQESTYIQNNCFVNTDLETITFSQNLENSWFDIYYSGMFSGCSSLKEINVDSNNPNFYSIDGVLYYNNWLISYPAAKTNEKVEVKDGTFSILTSAFQNNSYVKEVILPEGLEMIDDGVFENCISLESINFPTSLVEVGGTTVDEFQPYNYAFKGCTNLSKIDVSENNESFISDGKALYTKSYGWLIHWLNHEDEKVVIDNRVFAIAQYAFMGKENIKSIDIQNVNMIGYGAFDNCINLTDFYFRNIDYFRVDKWFDNTPNLKTMIIPKKQNMDFIIDKITYYIYPNSSAYECIQNAINNGQNINYRFISEHIDKTTNIQVDSGTCNNIDETTILKVNQIKEGNDYNSISKSLNSFDLYDIAFYKDDKKVDIDGTATVKIPVGNKDPEKCKVYYYDNGKYTDMNAVHEDGYMVFQTDHFSQYILTEEIAPEVNVVLGDVNEDGNIDFLDAIKVLNYDGELADLNENQLYAADVNNDESVDFLDAIMILRYDAELIEGFD